MSDSYPPEPPEADDDGPPANEKRLSLTSLFVLLTLASIVLALGRHLSLPVFAGVTGFMVLLLVPLLSARSALLHLGWWLLLATYVVAAAIAVQTRH